VWTNESHKPNYENPQDYTTLTIGIPKDPYFGYSLWLQENFKSFIFWAYNYEHLDYLDSYKKSKLRERNNRTGWTLVEKLPSFIKEAKNRAKLGKNSRKTKAKVAKRGATIFR
jgi:hypothetical protein